MEQTCIPAPEPAKLLISQDVKIPLVSVQGKYLKLNGQRWLRRASGSIAVGLLLCALALTGCTTVKMALPTSARHEAHIRSEGYSLLYDLMSQESGVSKVLIIKHVDPPAATLIKEIADVCGQAEKQLEQFAEEDHYLSLKMMDLPPAEQQTRAAIKSTTTKQLLLSTGLTFQGRLLLTQAESMNYASHLAKVLAEQEKNERRKTFLAILSQQCASFYDKVIEQLKILN